MTAAQRDDGSRQAIYPRPFVTLGPQGRTNLLRHIAGPHGPLEPFVANPGKARISGPLRTGTSSLRHGIGPHGPHYLTDQRPRPIG